MLFYYLSITPHPPKQISFNLMFYLCLRTTGTFIKIKKCSVIKKLHYTGTPPITLQCVQYDIADCIRSPLSRLYMSMQ